MLQYFSNNTPPVTIHTAPTTPIITRNPNILIVISTAIVIFSLYYYVDLHWYNRNLLFQFYYTFVCYDNSTSLLLSGTFVFFRIFFPIVYIVSMIIATTNIPTIHNTISNGTGIFFCFVIYLESYLSLSILHYEFSILF